MNWISVKEKLPEQGKDVLIFAPALRAVHGIAVGFLMGKNNRWRIIYDLPKEMGHHAADGFSPVTHWMPLPEIPNSKE